MKKNNIIIKIVCDRFVYSLMHRIAVQVELLAHMLFPVLIWCQSGVFLECREEIAAGVQTGALGCHLSGEVCFDQHPAYFIIAFFCNVI